METTTSSSSHYCEKCKKTMNANQFYRSRNLEKYPNDGLMNQCKKCLTMHVDNWNPETYLWILQDVDVPYIPDQWNKLMAKYCVPGKKVTGTTVLGRYLAKMQLSQWNKYHWRDNEFLQNLANKEKEEAMKRQGYDAAQIEEAIRTGSVPIPEAPSQPKEVAVSEYLYQPEEEEVSDIEMDLTDEDKMYLRLKWGKSYKPEEWVALEKLYLEMMDSYEIQTAGHIDTLKLICKTSLKCNQLIDCGDIEGFQKMSKVYDTLMKSGKFTAAQNKAESGDYVDSISELVLMCEKDHFIPRYYVDGPQDKVDYVIQDMQEYTHTLITEEMHLGELIERAVQKIEEDKLKELEDEVDDVDEEEAFERELFSKHDEPLTYEDYQEFQEFEDGLQEENQKLFKEMEDS